MPLAETQLFTAYQHLPHPQQSSSANNANNALEGRSSCRAILQIAGSWQRCQEPCSRSISLAPWCCPYTSLDGGCSSGNSGSYLGNPTQYAGSSLRMVSLLAPLNLHLPCCSAAPGGPNCAKKQGYEHTWLAMVQGISWQPLTVVSCCQAAACTGIEPG
jgi:hypothetical protein